MDKEKKPAGKTAEADRLFRMLDKEGQEEALRMLNGMKRVQKKKPMHPAQVKGDSF